MRRADFLSEYEEPKVVEEEVTNPCKEIEIGMRPTRIFLDSELVGTMPQRVDLEYNSNRMMYGNFQTNNIIRLGPGSPNRQVDLGDF